MKGIDQGSCLLMELPSVSTRILEKTLVKTMCSHMEDKKMKEQHGFTNCKLWLNSLSACSEEMASMKNERKGYLSQLLQGLLHGIPTAKLVRHGLDQWTTRWTHHWPYHEAPRVVMSCKKSNWWVISSNIYQESTLVWTFIHAFTANVATGMNKTFSKFTDDTWLGEQ